MVVAQFTPYIVYLLHSGLYERLKHMFETFWVYDVLTGKIYYNESLDRLVAQMVRMGICMCYVYDSALPRSTHGIDMQSSNRVFYIL